MQEIDNKEMKDFDDEINLLKLFTILIQGKKIIGFFTFFLSIIGIIYSFLLPNIYESEAMMAPVEESSSLVSGALKQYGVLSGLAGISLSDADDGNNSKKAIELMSSLSFFENYILPKIFLPDLMAIESWNDQTNTIIYDENIFIKNTNTWVRDFSYPKQLIPSAQESFEVFEEHFNLKEESDSGYVVLSVKHQSPILAKQWVEIIFEEVNNFYRQKDKAKSEKSVIFLNNQMTAARLSEIRQVVASLLEESIQKLTLIEANKDYVFEYIYPPSVMEEKSEPKRVLIFIWFFLTGFMFGVIIVLLRHYLLELKSIVKK